MKTSSSLILGLSILLGLLACGLLIGNGVKSFRTDDRVISVKGFAEKEVKADIAIWTLRLRSAGSSMTDCNLAVDSAKRKVFSFLSKNGVQENEIIQRDVQVTDRQAENTDEAVRRGALRYVITKTIEIKSMNVDNLLRISRLTDELLRAGVAMSTTQDWQGTGIRFMFTKLNDVKPGMLVEANRNARQAAVEIAKENGAGLGPLRKAVQGVFSIADRSSALNQGPGGMNEGSDVFKIVRVVVSNDYAVH